MLVTGYGGVAGDGRKVDGMMDWRRAVTDVSKADKEHRHRLSSLGSIIVLVGHERLWLDLPTYFRTKDS